MEFVLLLMVLFLVFSGLMLLVAFKGARWALYRLGVLTPNPEPMGSFFSPFTLQTKVLSNPKPVAISLTSFQRAALLMGAILFDFLFWEQLQGLNVLLWSLFLSGFLVGEYPEALRSAHFRAALASLLLSAACTVYYGSGVAKLATWVSLALLVGWVNQPRLRLVTNVLLTALANAWRVAGALLQTPRLLRVGGGRLQKWWYYGRLLGIPLVILLVFHLLFMAANPRYEALAGQVGAWLERWIDRFLVRISVPHVLFFGFGTFLTAGVLLRLPITALLEREARLAEFVTRQRHRLQRGAQQFTSTLALRKEYLAAVAVFGMVNGLLLVENVIDVRWLWFGFEPAPKFNLAQFVHEGTWVLIVSILLAMAIVLFFFRRNLNFYEHGLRRLRPLATVWVVQNAVLAVSVGLRNYYYITHMGVAYKRIGVYAFLLLVLFGLGTVLLKIWQRRSSFSLVRLNALAAWAMLLLLTVGNWEIWIARYNLQPQFAAHLDRDFLLQMPPRVLPELIKHEAMFDGNDQSGLSYHGQLRNLVETWPATYEERGWQSWTYADWQAYRYLTRAGGVALARR